MSGVIHRTVDNGGVKLHVVEEGEGPPVVFCHGFPHTWYVWHRQLPEVAAAGWRAVALDMRGYGQSSVPQAVEEYTNEKATSDLLAVLDDLGEHRAVLVGLDFGAALVWEAALRHPDWLRGVIVLNNPFVGRSRRRPSEAWAKAAEDHFLHVHYFQKPGVADSELNAHPREFLARCYFALSGDYHYLDTWRHPSHGRGYLDVLPEAPPLPWVWLSREDLDELASEFERTGFTGGLNWYRAIDLNWELTEPYAQALIEVPAYFIYGERDCDMEGFSGSDPIAAMRARVRDLREVAMVPGAGHLVQLERTAEVNSLLVRFLASL